MIEIKDSYGFGYRLYDKETGKYVANNAGNRFNALFCALLKNELNKPRKAKLHSVEEIGKIYESGLLQASSENINAATEGFLFYENYQLDLDEKLFYKNENVIRLIYQVMNDHWNNDEFRESEYGRIQAMVHNYKYMDKLIFGKEEEKTL